MKKKKTIAKYSPKPICTTRIRLTPDLEDLTELLAKNAHDVWAQQRLSHGWSHGPNRDDTNRKHPCLVPYDELPEVEKEYDRKVAIQSIKAVIALGYTFQKMKKTKTKRGN